MAKKIQLSYHEIEERLKSLHGQSVPASEVGCHLLSSYGFSEAELRRFREGKGVLKTFDGLLIKGLFCYRPASTLRLTSELERLKSDPLVLKAAPKIVAVSDGTTLLAYDLRERDTFENPLATLYCNFTFFYPLMGIERTHNVEENPADVKAAEKLAKLHDELRAFNEFSSDDDLHDLNIFITRLLFCFFAEDTGIFKENLFTNSIRQYTLEDGSDLAGYLDETFNVMDLKIRRPDTLKIVSQFPYVNGGLFARHIQIPRMSARARRIIIECGELDWQDINPDIFGSMIQAVVNPDTRANQGMHYTSVPNIMKVINPLFMDELNGEYQKLYDQQQRLRQQLDLGAIKRDKYVHECQPIVKACDKLLLRMSKMKFFDPACGSGNFLIITYKTLRLLEMKLMHLRIACNGQQYMQVDAGSAITLGQFYGIELLDFPHEVAMLSLWLAEHQMNKKLFEDFGINTEALPLKNITQIVCGNACRIDWNTVCPHKPEDEVFVFGNPPYLGSRRQDESQKKDLERLLKDNFGELDYIACWFVAGANYIKGTKAQYAFVSTNSICQGLQVALIWKKVLKDGLAIRFAYTSFKWANNAKYNAGVTCVIVGVANEKDIKQRYIYSENESKVAQNISPLLLDGPTVYVDSATRPLCKHIPDMNFGNMPADGGKLILSTAERDMLIRETPEIERFIKPLIGAEEFINGKQRWCFWLYNEDEALFMQFSEIQNRIRDLKEIRKKSSRPQLAAIPHLFAQITQPMGSPFILLPRHSSENREYIPIGYFEEGNIAHDSSLVIGSEDISLFGILTSRLHMTWVRAVGGRLETRYRYSAGLCYNTFPFPTISDSKKSEIEEAATEVLMAREMHPGKTLADLYDPDLMPDDLREAHHRLDDIVESCYPGYPFANDEACLECLFRLYEKMTKKK